MAGELVAVQIKRLPHAPKELPGYESDGAAGMDLRYAGAPVTVHPGERSLLPTGFAIAIPTGYEGQIRLRSGFALSSGLVLPNAPGTVDSDYRGEIKILVLNEGSDPTSIESGQRIAQLIVSPVVRCKWEEVEALPDSARGSDGFGSTGKG